jgi:hypothetical protein
MPDFKTRIVEEKDQLQERIIKLGNFISSPNFDDVSTANQRLLRVQHSIMSAYGGVLSERIEQLQYEEDTAEEQE